VVRQRVKATLLGVGLDKDDQGQTRVTRGRNFHLVGGSKDTHESMQEKCVKFNEKLQARGKEIEDLEAGEFVDLAQQCQMNLQQRKPAEG
jgi:hypothetical protein